MKVQPYLYFDGRCDEALDYYRKALGAEVVNLMRFKDGPPRPEGADESQCGPASPPDKVMHASFRIGETEIMASDGRCEGRPSFQGISLAITAANKEKAEKLFAAIADGGQVQMPLTPTFFSPAFGMAADRFGVSWLVVAEHAAA